MPESLIDHIRRHTTLAPNDAADAAQAVAEWLGASHAENPVERIALRWVARRIQAEVEREERRVARLLVLCDCPFHPCAHNPEESR